jgi:hypothetical protein
MPTYDGNREIEEGILHIQIAFGNDGEFSKPMEPRQLPLDESTEHAQPAAMLGPPLGQHRFDAPTSQNLPQALRVISPVALAPLRSATGPAAFATYRRDTRDQTQQQLTIRHVRPTDVRDQRDPVGIGHEMVLESRDGHDPWNWGHFPRPRPTPGRCCYRPAREIGHAFRGKTKFRNTKCHKNLRRNWLLPRRSCQCLPFSRRIRSLCGFTALAPNPEELGVVPFSFSKW